MNVVCQGREEFGAVIQVIGQTLQTVVGTVGIDSSILTRILRYVKRQIMFSGMAQAAPDDLAFWAGSVLEEVMTEEGLSFSLRITCLELFHRELLNELNGSWDSLE